MILAYDEIVELVERGVIDGVKLGAINGTSIDVHLGPHFRMEQIAPTADYPTVDLAKRQTPTFYETTLKGDERIQLCPGQFVLAHTVEVFHLPDDISAQFLLKSSVARCGLSHALATWADATWNNSTLTLELHNLLRWHRLLLSEGMPIGQMIFHRHAPVPAHASYRELGRYNNDAKATLQKA